MSWRHVTIKEICKIKSGKRLPKGKSFSVEETNFPYIRARDIKAGKINLENLVYLDEVTQKKLSQYIVNKNDIVITVVGASVGDVGYVSADLDGYNLTENAVRLTEFDESINSLYLLYLLNSQKYWEIMQSIAGGSAQPKLGIYKVESIPLELPTLDIQNRIVKSISTYDNLIENNQKQIKLLEEAAQRLYKEWFVDLRFPGHENVENVDGAPEGWSYKALKEISTLKAGGDKPRNFSKTLDREHFIPVYSNGTVDDGLYGYTDSAEIIDDSITISARGSVGYTCIRREPYVPIVRLISIIPRTIDVIYLFLYLKNKSFDSNGAAQQQLTIPMVRDFKVLIPSKEVLILFLEVMNPIFDKIDILKQQLMGLTEARDRLLPKLMSGEIEV